MFQPSIHNILPILAIITPGLSHNEYELFNLSYPRLRERTSVVSRLVERLVVFDADQSFLFGAREPSRDFRSTDVLFFDDFLVTVSASYFELNTWN